MQITKAANRKIARTAFVGAVGAGIVLANSGHVGWMWSCIGIAALAAIFWNPMIALVIVPTRRLIESLGGSPNSAWCVAQIVSWSLKALLAALVWDIVPREMALAYLVLIAVAGAYVAFSPWLGYPASSALKKQPSARKEMLE